MLGCPSKKKIRFKEKRSTLDLRVKRTYLNCLLIERYRFNKYNVETTFYKPKEAAAMCRNDGLTHLIRILYPVISGRRRMEQS